MLTVLAPMGLLILCGIGWRIIRPGGLDADLTRHVLATVVFNLLLPALILSVLWRTPLGLESLKISAFGVIVILAGVLLTGLVAQWWPIERRRLGAAMLGIAFPNVTYLGLPVLEQAFGAWTHSLVIQIDLFASMPLVLTLGVFIARYYGEEPSHGSDSILNSLLKNPPLWTALAAVALNLGGIPMPVWLAGILDKLSAAVIPLMLIVLGLGLRWNSWRLHNLPLSAIAVGLRLVAIPWLAVSLGRLLGFSGDNLAGLVMEAGMPSMLLGVVYCDRYRLDTPFYAMIVALTTLAGLFSLPYWHGLLA